MRREGCIRNEPNCTCRELAVTEAEGKGSVPWIRRETAPGFSPRLSTKVLHIWRQGLKDRLEREGLALSNEPQQ